MRYTTMLSALAIAALAGCASSRTPEVSDGPAITQSTRVVGHNSSMEMQTSSSVARGVVMVHNSLGNTWKALIAAYDSVGIPVTSSNPGEGVLGNEGLRVRRRLKDVPLIRYLDCGSTQGGPSAETYDITLVIRTHLQPTPEGIRATTLMQATGRPVSLAGNTINCTSTGRLEARIGDLLGGKPLN